MDYEITLALLIFFFVLPFVLILLIAVFAQDDQEG
jgi:hypothetical protein